MIDWISWTEITNTLLGRGTRILPDGSTGVVWSTPSRISGDAWRTSRYTLSNIRTTAVGKNETGLPTDQGLSVGYYPDNWMGDGLSHLYNDGTDHTAGAARKSYVTSSNLPLGIANLRNFSTQQFRIECSAYLVTSASQPAKNQLERFPNKVGVPMEGIVFADAEASSWHIPSGQKEYISISPTPYVVSQNVTCRLLKSVRTPGCITNPVVGKVSVSTPVGNRPDIKMRPGDAECNAKVHNGYDPSSVVLLSSMHTGYVEVHGGGRGAVAFGVASYMDHGDIPENYGVAGNMPQPAWSDGELSDSGERNTTRGKAPYKGDAGDWYNLSAVTDQGNVVTTSSAVMRLGALTNHDGNTTHSADISRDNITDTGDKDALPAD